MLFCQRPCENTDCLKSVAAYSHDARFVSTSFTVFTCRSLKRIHLQVDILLNQWRCPFTKTWGHPQGFLQLNTVCSHRARSIDPVRPMTGGREGGLPGETRLSPDLSQPRLKPCCGRRRGGSMKEEGDSVSDSAELCRKRQKQSIQFPTGNHSRGEGRSAERPPKFNVSWRLTVKTLRGCGSYRGGTPVRSLTTNGHEVKQDMTAV